MNLVACAVDSEQSATVPQEVRAMLAIEGVGRGVEQLAHEVRRELLACLREGLLADRPLGRQRQAERLGLVPKRLEHALVATPIAVPVPPEPPLKPSSTPVSIMMSVVGTSPTSPASARASRESSRRASATVVGIVPCAAAVAKAALAASIPACTAARSTPSSVR